MEEKENLTQDFIKKSFNYNPETGEFSYKNRINKNPAGKVVTTKTCENYLSVGINNKTYMVHRLIWLYMFGKFPSGLIDHINGDASDNRLVNLREVTCQQNLMNAKLSVRNKSGVKGVDYYKATGEWRGRVMFKGKTHLVGFFANLQDAERATKMKREELHGEYTNHG